jgi:hypothetical protein
MPLRIQARAFSVLNRPKPNYPGHVPLTFVERCGLAVGSALGSMLDHHRHGTAYPLLTPSVLSILTDTRRPSRCPRRGNMQTLLHHPSATEHAVASHRPPYPP